MPEPAPRRRLAMLQRASRHAESWAADQFGPAGPRLPKHLNFPVTDNCNARCVMCDVWKTRSQGELDATEVRQILADPLFAALEHVGLSGGEPSLRGDLPEIVDAVLERPSLQSLSITSHGFHTARWGRMLPGILEACRLRGVPFLFNVSVDGVGEVHDRIRGVPGASARTLETSRLAQSLGATVRWQATLSADNVFGVVDLLEHAQAEGVELTYRVATTIPRLDNDESVAEVALDADEASFLADFLTSPALSAHTPLPTRRLFYRDLAHRITSGVPRRAPCHYQSEGIVLTAQGDLYHCSVGRERIGNVRQASASALYFAPEARAMRERLLARTCPGCIHDQSGAWPPHELAAEVLRAAPPLSRTRLAARAFGLGARGVRALGRDTLGARGKALPSAAGKLDSVTLIGAYGGEHVGDAAILGGVLQRLARDHEVERATVLSLRPHRTERWLRSLALPFPVSVAPYDATSARRTVEATDAVVHAGGPLMDLPELLVRHLDVAAQAVALGRPVLLEGIGVGPFRLAPSRAFARRLVALSSFVRVRTPSALRDPIMADANALVDRDPAFDYLATRGALDHLPDREATAVDRLLARTEGRLRIGVNLRPLWHKYGGNAADMAALEGRTLALVAEGLRRFAAASPRPVSFLFVPFNADQLGFSDFLPASRLATPMADLDYHVLLLEPGVDAVLRVLRALDGCVAMRFHACIFALSQGVPTVGIDYAVGKRGKVGELFTDLGQEEACTRIDELDPDWLAERLAARMAAAPRDPAPP